MVGLDYAQCQMESERCTELRGGVLAASLLRSFPWRHMLALQEDNSKAWTRNLAPCLSLREAFERRTNDRRPFVLPRAMLVSVEARRLRDAREPGPNQLDDRQQCWWRCWRTRKSPLLGGVDAVSWEVSRLQ